MINSKAIQRAIGQYLDGEGETVVTLAEKLDVSHPTVVRWRSGDTKVIRSQHWVKLRYLLAPYLEDDAYTVAEPSAAYEAGPASGVMRVPVLGLTQMASVPVDPTACVAWLGGQATSTEMWPAAQVAGTDLCLRVEGNELEPQYPAGALLLVAVGEVPEPGDTVVARCADQPAIMLARRLPSDYETLASDPKPILADRLLWAWPVVQVRIDLRPARGGRSVQ